MEYEGSAFEPYLGQVLTISSRGTIKPNRKVFIRAAARINYATPVGGERRYNFSEVREVNIPEYRGAAPNPAAPRWGSKLLERKSQCVSCL